MRPLTRQEYPWRRGIHGESRILGSQEGGAEGAEVTARASRGLGREDRVRKVPPGGLLQPLISSVCPKGCPVLGTYQVERNV